MNGRLMYSGNGGVCSRGFHLGSISLLIAVSGRILLLRYFSSQQLMKLSVRPIVTNLCRSPVFLRN